MPAHENTLNTLSLSDLVGLFLAYLAGQASAGNTKPATVRYYRHELTTWLGTLPAGAMVRDLKAFHLTGTGNATWHRIQTAQRLFNWAVQMELVGTSPFTRVKRPPAGQRDRTLTVSQTARLLLGAARPFRWLLVFLRHTIARPGEIRALQWMHFQEHPGEAGIIRQFVLSDFKARHRRKDGAARRIIPIDPYLGRLLARWKARRNPAPTDYILLNRFGAPWTKDAVVQAMETACRRAGLNDGTGERIVAYSMRHTAATTATRNGVRDRQLADLMGHTNPRMTARYQHLDEEHLGQVIEQAIDGRRRRQQRPNQAA